MEENEIEGTGKILFMKIILTILVVAAAEGGFWCINKWFKNRTRRIINSNKGGMNGLEIMEICLLCLFIFFYQTCLKNVLYIKNIIEVL